MLGSCGCAFAPTHRQESFAPTSHNVVRVFNGVPYLLQILASALELGMLRFYLTPYCRGEPDLPAGFGGNSEEGVSRHHASPLLPLDRPGRLRGDVPPAADKLPPRGPHSHSIVPGGFEVMFRLRRI